MCSTITNQCPSNTVSGYRVAHNTFLNLKELEEYERNYIEKNKIVVKFECKELGAKT